MARAYPLSDMSDPAHEPHPGEWQALRGELVALLDQVEGRYARVEEPEPAMAGFAQRVRSLREQVVTPEPTVRRREALRTVKRAVDRFSERDDTLVSDEHDALSSAIAEIRGRQMSASAPAPARRSAEMPELRDLTSLVTGLSGRLERLEGELKAQRGNGSVREVAMQVEQLTHVVELLAGAVGETGQVKRLEAQIGALAAMIEDGPRVDLSTINNRLDDVSATVGKLAELQAEQMEREIVREERKASEPVRDGAEVLVPVMDAIEQSVRNVYDRIDAIERNVALGSNDFERLTSELSAFTLAMKDRDAAPDLLIGKVDEIAARIGGLDSSNRDIAGLKSDISDLRDAVMSGIEPRFMRLESQIDALSDRIVPTDTTQVENQLKLLMARMDETGAQLNTLASLYSNQEGPDFEALATMVAERTSEAVTRKSPSPVAMFGPDSLKSIEDRLTSLIKSAGKTPDYDALADLVAEKTSAAVAKTSAPAGATKLSDESMGALETRMTALFNTAGKETAERLTRLEATLSARQAKAATETSKAAPAVAKAASTAAATVTAAPADEPAEEARIEAMLTALAGPKLSAKSDTMPANPADDAPLIDPGFKDLAPVRTAIEARSTDRARPNPAAPRFNPADAELPPRPKSSFAGAEADPFAPRPAEAVPQVEAPASHNSTSTFVAAARRAQRARQDGGAAAVSANSAISRALSRFLPEKDAAPAVVDQPDVPAKAKKPAKPVREKKAPKAEPVAAPEPAQFASVTDGDVSIETTETQQSFLIRYRRPLLLSAALVAVSLLALNLVMQRSGGDATPAPATSAAAADVPEPTEPAPASNPAPTASDEVSLVRPEARVIDMLDNTAVGSITPASAGFTKPTASTAMPSTLVATPPSALPATPATPAAIAFELPPESVGPLELRQAAADGDARAQFEIGAIYTEGRAVTQDYAEAAKWYERSAAQGFVPAQYRLGNLYEGGTGVDKDLEQAKLWYQRGAEAGNRMSMHNLAALYASGQLGEQEFEAAAEWFQQAAARGMTDSQFNLGMLYARGLGVEQDFSQSYKWFSLAARSGDADAAKARDDIAKSLSSETVSAVNAELAGWKAESIDLAANFAPLGTWTDKFDPGQAIKTRDVVSKVQQALTRLGFDVGSPDGVAGPKTADAIKAFERGTGMTEVGAVNPRLLAVLGSQPV
ncbi:hypothetical protein WH87_16945 [Devosia epidermidihirudinis]|uniref:Peptidoglycan binding-like domain-containing protein n=1 Tax=Devosia epidermidihirudinis TaxID=1293439 RepID=A0A0F5Q301_9HYPH|nr:peptidoglycan-binding protein [Devosia epidermidihirudinis]KKC35277.1 hypothetical protein WH87_16945 [Devosia epidermidihirudinis]